MKIDYKRLADICQADIDTLMDQLDGKIVDSPQGKYAYKDNGSKILAVAHLDTVQQDTTLVQTHLKDDTLVFCPKLDDRLGVYTILDVLPRMGIKVDILFTENEEIGRSTAQLFETDKRYNWIVEFDRHGENVVTYDYGDMQWDGMLAKFFKVQQGLFSDISYLEHLECKGVNIGIGYYDEHSKRAYFVVEEYIRQIKRFAQFYNKYHDQRFAHEYIAMESYSEWWYDDDRNVWGAEYWCYECHTELVADEVIEIGNHMVCKECGQDVYPLEDWSCKGV